MNRLRLDRRLIPWLVAGAGLALAFHPALLSGFRSVQIRPSDPRLVNYLFEHATLWLARHPLHRAFWSPPVFHPVEGVGAYTDTVVGTAPLYALWRLAGASPGVAFQLWMMGVLSLGFAVGYVLLRRTLGTGRWPAAVGALLIGFGGPRLASFASPQLFAFFPGLLALLAACEALRACDAPHAGRGRAAVWIFTCFGALTLQAWSAFYPAYFAGLVLAAAALACLAVGDARRRLAALLRRHPAAVAAAAALALAAVAPLARAYLAVPGPHHRSAQAVERHLPGPASWIYPGNTSVVYGGLSGRGPFAFRARGQHPSQHSNGFGLLTTGLAAAGLVAARRRPAVRVTLVATGLLLLLCTRLPGDLSLWMGMREVLPGAGAIRYLGRIGMWLAIPVAVGLALFLDRLAARRHAGLALALCVLCIAEQTHRLGADDDGAYEAAVEKVARAVGSDCTAFFLSASEDPERPVARLSRLPGVHGIAMFAANRAGVPTMNGNLGRFPRGYDLEDLALQAVPDPGAERAVRAWARRNGLDPDGACLVSVPAHWMPWLRSAK